MSSPFRVPAAHLTLIIADNFFLMAALIGFRPVDFFETGATFLGSGLAFYFAHQAAILARAAGLIRRRFKVDFSAALTGKPTARVGLKVLSQPAFVFHLDDKVVFSAATWLYHAQTAKLATT
jgi:hypothetical protein